MQKKNTLNTTSFSNHNGVFFLVLKMRVQLLRNGFNHVRDTKTEDSGTGTVYHGVHTALMPFSCCAELSSMMVRSCQRTLRSVKSSQGFLARKPSKLFFSFSISSHSRSHEVPCSCLRAKERTNDTHTRTTFFSSDQAPGCFFVLSDFF